MENSEVWSYRFHEANTNGGGNGTYVMSVDKVMLDEFVQGYAFPPKHIEWAICCVGRRIGHPVYSVWSYEKDEQKALGLFRKALERELMRTGKELERIKNRLKDIDSILEGTMANNTNESFEVRDAM